MYGTLARALSARKVEFDPNTYKADVLGTIEGEDNQTIRITKIHVVFQIPGIAGRNSEPPLSGRSSSTHRAVPRTRASRTRSTSPGKPTTGTTSPATGRRAFQITCFGNGSG